jgi:hypothetical protein
VFWTGVTSPFSVARNIPFRPSLVQDEALAMPAGDWRLFGGYVGFIVVLNGLLLVLMIWLFNTRWRVSG